MNLSPDVLQALFSLALVVAGFAVKSFFPNLKLPGTPASPVAPATPSVPANGIDLVKLIDLIRNSVPQQIPTPAVSITTATHDVSIDGAGVNVAAK